MPSVQKAYLARTTATGTPARFKWDRLLAFRWSREWEFQNSLSAGNTSHCAPHPKQEPQRFALAKAPLHEDWPAVLTGEKLQSPKIFVISASSNSPKETECRPLCMYDAQELIRSNTDWTGWCSVRAGVFVLRDPLGRNLSGKRRSPGFLSSHVCLLGMGPTWFNVMSPFTSTLAIFFKN